MPRYRRREYSRRGSALPLVLLLVLAIILLLLLWSGKTLTLNLPDINVPPLPNITIPITGLPQIRIPENVIQITIEPGTLIPGIAIGGTPAAEGTPAVAGAPNLGSRTKTSGCQNQGSLPDRACSPGSVMNTDAAQVCQSGYASSVRDVSQQVKDEVLAEYGVSHPRSGQYEVDHLVPLELGGSNDISNLWAQPSSPRPGFHEKDVVENYLHSQVCSGKMSLAAAQQAIATNWVAVYNQMPK